MKNKLELHKVDDSDLEYFIKEYAFMCLEFFLINNDMDKKAIRRLCNRIACFKIEKKKAMEKNKK